MPKVQEETTFLAEDPTLHRVRINYRWLLKLRWTAVVGQLLTIVVVMSFVTTDLPYLHLAIIVGVTAITNVVLQVRFGYGEKKGGLDQPESVLSEAELFAIMGFDVILFSGLLCVTGGVDNPFSIFYLVHVVLAAIVLRPRWAWAVALECVFCFAFLFVQDTTFPAPQEAVRMQEVRHWGAMGAFCTVALTIAWFVVHIREELEQRENDLLEIRQKRSRLDRLEALITLAAGAAHELSTPLSTIAVAAGELQHDLRELSQKSGLGQDALADVNLIRTQVKRCRDILEQMSADSGELSGEPMMRATVGELMTWILEPVPRAGRVNLDLPDDLGRAAALIPRKALTRALRGLVRNALDADEGGGEVQVEIRRRGDIMSFLVKDRGPGMSPEISQRAFEPFFTTKAPGRGMGLGLYLSRSVVERLGGTLELVKTGPQGTTMKVEVPILVEEVIHSATEKPSTPDSGRSS